MFYPSGSVAIYIVKLWVKSGERRNLFPSPPHTKWLQVQSRCFYLISDIGSLLACSAIFSTYRLMSTQHKQLLIPHSRSTTINWIVSEPSRVLSQSQNNWWTHRSIHSMKIKLSNNAEMRINPSEKHTSLSLEQITVGILNNAAQVTI